jgi:hypothetical protein
MPLIFIYLFYLWWYWGLNLGLCTCKAGALPLELYKPPVLTELSLNPKPQTFTNALMIIITHFKLRLTESKQEGIGNKSYYIKFCVQRKTIFLKKCILMYNTSKKYVRHKKMFLLKFPLRSFHRKIEI